MIEKRELAWILISIIIFGFIIGFTQKITYSPKVFIIAGIIILTSIIGKEVASKHYFADIKHQMWEFQRYGFAEKAYLKKPFPIGIFLPFFVTFLTLGLIKPMTLLQFKAKPSKTRILKKSGRVRKSQLNESDYAFIAAGGFYGLILIIIFSILVNQPELARYSLYYALWNLAPVSHLDGSKLFFGSFTNWCILVIFFIILMPVFL